MVHMASAQLELISSHPNWKLDRETIEVGRAGIAKARAVLEEAYERAEAQATAAATATAAASQLADNIQYRAKTQQTGGGTVTQLVIELPELAAAA